LDLSHTCHHALFSLTRPFCALVRVQGESKAAGKSTVDEPESDDDMPELEQDDGTTPSAKVDEPESEEEEVVTKNRS
jgi:hypothetical protein